MIENEIKRKIEDFHEIGLPSLKYNYFNIQITKNNYFYKKKTKNNLFS